MATLKYLPTLFALLLILLTACGDTDAVAGSTEQTPEDQTLSATSLLQEHLDAVSSRNLEALKKTLHPEGKMQLILPGAEIMYTADSFMLYHAAWFQDTNWTFETQILTVEAGQEIAMAVTEVIYREPLRDGKPYFNRMIVSYDLEKHAGQWYVIKDHASSVEKSTD